MRNQVQLCTYVDRLAGGGLASLDALLRGPLAGLFGGVHLLPFYHPIDGADAGFDPVDHTLVDHRLGTWDDIERLAAHVELVADVIVNHVSARSPQFLDYRSMGRQSPYAGMFLAFEKVFPAGATECDLMMLYRPRPGLPFTAFPIAGEGKRLMWTTFTAEQVDIDVEHPASEAYLGSILDRLAANGVRMVRLDAVGYAIKRAGTRSFMTEETLAFIDRLAAQANRRGIEVLVEIHSHYRTQIDIARRVDWIYDFALPPLMLHALFRGTARYLKEWISIRPNNAVTVLDTHDGIGVIDVGADDADRERHPGLLPPTEIAHLVERIHTNSGGESLRATGTAASNVDLYQVNCTYFDALGRDERAYLAARAVQFFLPGIPQVYYVGLLGGVNDMALLEKTGVGRDINRHHYATGEVENALQAPVVRSLVDLIRFRNSHPAFSGTMHLQESPDHVLRICWKTANTHALLEVDLEQRTHNISASGMPTMQGILS